MGEKKGREFFEGWLSPWNRNLAIVMAAVLAVGGLAVLIVGIRGQDSGRILIGTAVALVAWLLSILLPDPIPAPRKPLRRRAVKLRRVGGHQLPG